MSMINQVNVNGVDYDIEGTGGGVTDVKVSQNGTDYSSVVDGGVAKIDLSGRAKQTDLTTHTGDTDVHVASGEKDTWNGKYSKPTGGIPKSDLADDVKTSLGKADTALQTHQDISGKADVSALTTHTSDTGVHVNSTEKGTWNGKYSKPSAGIPKSDLESNVQTSLGKADTISGSETWTFEIEGGTSVTKKVLLAV